MATNKKKVVAPKMSEKARLFLKNNPNFDPNKTRITKGVVGVRFQSEKYGCYDSNMPPHPEWNPPATWMVMGAERPISPVFYIGSQDDRMKLTAQYHPYPDFMIPEKSDFMTDEASSAKLSKNNRPSLVLYMSPVKRNSFAINTCAGASLACELTCLDYSGQKVTQNTQRLAIARTDMYLAQPDAFFTRAYNQIMKKHADVNRRNAGKVVEIAVRFNGTSDRDIFKEFAEWCIARKLSLPSNIVFYDYTKMAEKVTTTPESEYDNIWAKKAGIKVRHKVTYSLSEIYESKDGYDSRRKAVELVKKGATVAAVFLINPKGEPAWKDMKNKKGALPAPVMADGTKWVRIAEKWYEPLPKFADFEDDNGNIVRIPILDGDETDDLMLDARDILKKMYPDYKGGCILGLRAKMRAMDDTSGFALPVYAVYDRKNRRKAAEARNYIESVLISMRSDREVCIRAAKLDKAYEKDPIKFFAQMKARTTEKNMVCSPDKWADGNVIEVW